MTEDELKPEGPGTNGAAPDVRSADAITSRRQKLIRALLEEIEKERRRIQSESEEDTG